ncbi:Autophagy-related protein 38 [Cyberlindnera fabianii]|uniref:Autophagy-related protein 38 n=1 Tax=Cyberlindnera fabianii TaxID=36022 RepID=A0A1V2LAI2_CYBFA|nr:Autophagy-related protein 38 [Cyberlindnera fabianii]
MVSLLDVSSQLYAEAARQFKKQVSSSENKEIQSALTLLSDQYTKRSEELLVLDRTKAKLPVAPTSSTPPSPTARTRHESSSISSSLASARGGTMSVNLSDTAILYGDDNTSSGDPVTRFQVAVYNLIRAPNVTIGTELQPMKQIKPSGKSVEELEIENAALKQLLSSYSENMSTYDSFHKKVKTSLKHYLSTLKREINQQESQIKKDYENKIEQLYKDNKRLEQQVGSLKSRWDALVESAKKRREDQKSSSSAD